MLLASILSILEQNRSAQAKSKTAETADIEPFSLNMGSIPEAYQPQEKRGRQTHQALERGLASPVLPSAPGSPATSLYGLIQAISKFEKEPKRVVDVFE